MLFLKRAYFWATLCCWTLLCLVASLPFYLAASALCADVPGTIRKAVWWYGKIVFLLLRPICPIHSRNADQARAIGPCIITANHQSFLDIYLLCAQTSRNLCFIVAKWPYRKLFFFAFMMYKARYIRAWDERDALVFFQSCRQELDSGATLVCFPEGTRSRTGALQRFHSGIFRVAAKTGVPVVPMVFHNSGKLCPPGSFAIHPQPVEVTLLEPFTAECGLSDKKAGINLQQRVHEAMRNCLNSFPTPP